MRQGTTPSHRDLTRRAWDGQLPKVLRHFFVAWVGLKEALLVQVFFENRHAPVHLFICALAAPPKVSETQALPHGRLRGLRRALRPGAPWPGASAGRL